MRDALSRREFLKLGGLAAGGLALAPWNRFLFQTDFPQAERLGRVNVGKVDLRARPNIDSPVVGSLYEDAVVPWLREVVGTNLYRMNQRFVETPEGYIWSPFLQPVRNEPNTPVESLPETSKGPGMWVEVTVPYADLSLENSAPIAPSTKHYMENGLPVRVHYSQILWVDQLTTNSEGKVVYRLNEPYGSYGDIFWGAAEAFRPLTAEEMAPISPEVENKRVEVNIRLQTLSCYEDEREVHFCRISSGQGQNSTPIGEYFQIWRKLVSIHMSGGTTGGGWDLPGIGWTTLFQGDGIAVHSTFWHNNFGEPMSHGCVNASPDDAKFVFRWTAPSVPYDPGDVTVEGLAGTRISVLEG